MHSNIYFIYIYFMLYILKLFCLKPLRHVFSPNPPSPLSPQRVCVGRKGLKGKVTGRITVNISFRDEV
nr:MAG TPA: hypothetical protein [Caudoviricetes sp.]